jgi:hypothetical protein
LAANARVWADLKEKQLQRQSVSGIACALNVTAARVPAGVDEHRRPLCAPRWQHAQTAEKPVTLIW